MFNLFKENGNKNIYAPVKGKCIDISEVDDIGFSSKSMGDGVAFNPESQIIVSPCNGELKMIFRTGHAFGIKANNGFEILIHIGIDTVNLEGKGFTILKEVDQKVKKGDPIIEIDLEQIKKLYDPTVIMVITNGKKFNKLVIGESVDLGVKVLEGID